MANKVVLLGVMIACSMVGLHAAPAPKKAIKIQKVKVKKQAQPVYKAKLPKKSAAPVKKQAVAQEKPAPAGIFAVTIPKSGTHMIAKCVTCLTKRDVINVSEFIDLSKAKLPANPHNEAYRAHLRYSPEADQFFSEHQFKGVLMIRDPRDQAVSMTYWIVLRPVAHPQEAARYKADPSYFNEVLMERIKGINDYYQPFMPWMKHPSFYTAYFENLVGSRGGGAHGAQMNELQGLAHHFQVSERPEKLRSCAKSLFGGTATFRKGQIGSWRKHYSADHKQAFKEVAGQLLIDLGYEKDLEW